MGPRPRFVAIAAATLTVAVTAGALTAIVQDHDDGERGIALRAPRPAGIATRHVAPTGVALTDDPAGVVDLGDEALAHDGVLLRIGAGPAAGPVRVLADGVPALDLDADEAGSTTVLVPVLDGGVRLSATVATTVDVQPVAYLDSDADAPGSTVPVTPPVTRADTPTGLGGPEIGTTPLTVGLTGLGGVPATGVRAVHVTAHVLVPAPTELVIGGARHAVPAGATAITTIVVPDEAGATDLALSQGTGALRLDVRGWIPEAATDHAVSNTAGSFVPAADAVPRDLSATTTPTALPDLGGGTDTAHWLALVSATPTPTGTMLHVGTGEDRLVVDRTAGATAQIVVVDADEAASLWTGDGGTRVGVLPLGSLLGDVPEETEPGPAPVVAAHDPGPVDLTTDGTVHLSGTVQTPGASIESIHVLAGGRTVATATVRPGPDGSTWSAETSVPSSGTHELTVEARTRDGAVHETRTVVDAVLPAPDELVVASGLRTTADVPARLVEVTDDGLVFDADPTLRPGDVLAIDPTPTAPHGLLRRVLAVDRTATGWSTSTAQAALTDVVLQADEEVDIDVDVTDADIEPLDPVLDTAPGVLVVDEGAPPLTVGPDTTTEVSSPAPDSPTVPGETTPPPSTGDPAGPSPDAAIDPSSTGGAAVILPAAGALPRLDLTPRVGVNASGLTVWRGDQTQDLSRAGEETRAAALAAIRESGGAAVATEAHAEVSLHVTLRIGLKWSWGIPRPTLAEHRLALGHDIGASIAVDSYRGEAVEHEATLPAARVTIPTTVIPIGPVPLVVSATMDVDLRTRATIDVAAHASASFSVTGTYGYEYTSRDGVRTLDDDPAIGYGTPDVSLGADSGMGSGTVRVSAGVRVATQVWFYEVVGPRIMVGAMPGLELSTNAAGDPITARLFADVEAEGGVGLKVPVIGVGLDATLATVRLTVPVARFTVPFTGGPAREEAEV